MPGLLQSTDSGVASFKFVAAFFAELIGVLIFTLYGSAVASTYGPWGNGITLAVLVYLTANVSGGHLNPAVTIATMIGLLPGQSIGMGDAGMGCFKAGTGLTRGMAFGWEFVMTFLLVAVVYAVAIGKPSFTETGPLAVGFALWCSAFVAGEFTGASLNPARTLGPAFVYHCNWRYAWVYVLAELLGGITAGIVSWPLYGTAATDGENGEEGGDEEQGGGDGGQKDKKGQSHKAQPDQQRGLLKTPAGQHQQIRSRTVGQEANGHTYPEYEPQQYQTPVYAPHPQPYVNDSPNEYETYRSPEPMTRHPSINMDWQTLRVPR
ncbi:MAG: Aquaporin NIP1-2 [Trebouxia sp. A1-2]|nr:MAG: Aquaporin NIP1-2 [Trebouxia sp. A1-2]